MSGDVMEAQEPPIPGTDNVLREAAEPNVSFKDTLLSGMQIDDEVIEDVGDEVSSETDMDSHQPPWDPNEIVTSVNGVWPSMTVADSVVKKLAKPWSRSLVVKLFQRTIGYNALMNRLQRLWNPMGRFQIVDLEENYYLVRFSNDADWVHALCDGPWSLMGTYLVVQQWTPDFDIEKGITRITAWVRFPKLPVHWYNKHFLRYLGNLVGRTVKIDMNTQQGNRGKFARVAVSLDTSKPLLDKFELNGKWYKIEYEGIQSVCFACGCMGHTRSSCPTIPVEESNAEDENVQNNANINVGNSLVNGEGSANHWQETPSETENRFGPWMQVRRTKRPVRKEAGNGDPLNQSWKQIDNNPIYGSDGGKADMGSGSRFDVLAQDTEEPHNAISQESSEQIAGKITEQIVGNITESQTKDGTVVHGGKKAGGSRQLKQLTSDGFNSHSVESGSSSQRNNNETGPVTVGPLSHNQALTVSAEKSLNGKMRKLQAQKEKQTQAENTKDSAVTATSGKKMGSGDSKEVGFWKPLKSKNTVGVRKRKQGSVYQKEQPPDGNVSEKPEAGNTNMEEQEFPPILPAAIPANDAMDLPMENEDEMQLMIVQEGPEMVDA